MDEVGLTTLLTVCDAPFAHDDAQTLIGPGAYYLVEELGHGLLVAR